LSCGGGVIDEVDYDVAGFPSAPDAVAMQLDPTSSDFSTTFPHTSNDEGANWCLAPPVVESYDGTHRGTPGQLNFLCD
jgi:hypothetical protein